jgi:Xaa-Pro aminopeptidase
MPIDLAAVQRALQADGLDAWLLYDFHGSNPIARRVAGLVGSAKLTTRRWYYLIPAHDGPRALVHAIEQHSLDHLPGRKSLYAGRRELEEGLRTLVEGCRRLAMEYSPNCAIPYLSRVDAGTAEAIRRLGVEIVSSGDLVQRFEAVWDSEALATHREASERLHRIKERAFDAISQRCRSGERTTEFDIQQLMTGWFVDEGLVSDSSPVVAARESSANPHYLPTATEHRPICKNDIVLLDLWGKLNVPGAVYADITWVGFVGRSVPAEYANAFAAVRAARDAAITLVERAVAAGQELRGWQVDRAARTVIDQAGFGRHFVHRTGHSLGTEVHGNGVHMDDYETHDDRRLLPGTGFTVEPGVYFEHFGVRTEINMHVGEREALVTGPMQTDIVPLG